MDATNRSRFGGRKSRDVRALGFDHGAHGISPNHTLDGIDADTERDVALLKRDWASKIKDLEADGASLTREGEAARKRFSAYEGESPSPPPIALATIAVFLGAIAFAGELAFLMPVMDGFGLAGFGECLFAASSLVFVSAVFFTPAVRVFFRSGSDGSRGPATRLLAFGVILATAVALAFTVALGVWRGDVMVFSGSLAGGAIGTFLESSSTLTKVMFTLLTVALPLGGALAVEWGLAALERAWRWRRALRAADRLERALDGANKRLEAAQEQREREIEARTAERGEAAAQYLEYYEQGVTIGARRLPLWYVVAKIAVATMLALALSFVTLAPIVLVPLVGPLIAIVLAGVVALLTGALYAVRAIRVWDRPTPTELLRQRATLWRGEHDSAHPRVSVPFVAPHDAGGERERVRRNGGAPAPGTWDDEGPRHPEAR
jgi:hypothetical protein